MLNLNTPKQNNSRRKTISLETPTYRTTRRSTLLAASKRDENPKTPLVLSQEPVVSTTPNETKKATPVIDKTPKSRVANALYEKIKRDLNSPSAAARIRAQRALKSPGFCKANYQIFDVPHEEQDIITEEERKPYKPKTIREIFANCRIYVEVRTGDDNRSAGIKNKLMSDGICVNEKLYKDTTHVIFKDGLLSTYKQAKKLGIPITTILWIESCKTQRRLVETSKFPISNQDRYEHPEIYGRVRRQKSMQPELSKAITLPPNKFSNILNKSEDIDEDETITNDSTPNCEETVKDCAEMEMTASQETFTSSSIEMATQVQINTAEKIVTNRRLTTFTPRQMEQTNCEISSQAWKSIDRRRTIFGKEFNDDSTPKNSINSVSRKSIIFNSSNRIGSATRRSILDISMNIFELNCKAISESKKKNEEVHEDNQNSSSKNITTTQIVPKPAVVRKRKLFSIEDHDESVEYKENCKTPENTSTFVKKKLKCDNVENSKTVNGKKTSKVSAGSDRRKTISFFKTRDNTDDSGSIAKITPTKPSTKYIVCTNMSCSDRELAKVAIAKLGGVLEKEVTDKTTHVITPNTERTMNLLRGIIRACYIVKCDWIIESVQAKMFLDTTMFQHDICNNQKICERSILGKNFKNLTFSHYGPFYVRKESIDSTKKYEYVKEIIELCNGSFTNNINDANIVVSDRPLALSGTYQGRKPIVIISTYIFDAAMQGKLIPNFKYTPKF